MTDQIQKTQALTLKGSAVMVRQYLSYAINSILYQREICRPETFETVEKFGLPIMMSKQENVISTINSWLDDAEKSIFEKGLDVLTFVIFKANTNQVIEKWEFKIEYESKNGDAEQNDQSLIQDVSNKDIKIIQAEIRTVLRQIIGSVSYLPLMDPLNKFQVLLRELPHYKLPPGWTPITYSDSVANSEKLPFRSFSTCLHKVESAVTYKKTEDT